MAFVTGHKDFDRLNARLGLHSVRPPHSFEETTFVTLCLDNLVNVRAAVKAYSKLDGVSSAMANWYGGDAPDVDAAIRNDTWYVVFRDAWGDCPAGCIADRLFFFRVEGDEVKRIPEVEALEDRQFEELVELVRHRAPVPRDAD